MCRNITTLRGLEPEATAEEIEAAARQYVRKVSGVQSVSAATEAAFELAVGRSPRRRPSCCDRSRRASSRRRPCRRCAACAPSPADVAAAPRCTRRRW